MRRTTQRALAAAGIIAVAALLTPLPLRADPDERVLNGHRFMPTGNLPEPFVTSFVRSSTGGAVFELPLLNVEIEGDEVGLIKGNVLYITQGFEYQAQVTNWLAVRASGSGLGRGGIEGSSILAQGVSWGFSGNLGVTARLWRGNSAQLSAAADITGGSLWGINLIDFVSDIIDNGFTKDSSVVDDVTTSYPRGGLRAAWAPTPWLGFTGYVDTGWTESWGRAHSTESVWAGGASVGFDFSTTGGPPVGLLFTYEVDPFLQGGDDATTELSGIGGGIFYTGREDLGLGLEVTGVHAPQGYDDEKITVIVISTVMHYYF